MSKLTQKETVMSHASAYNLVVAIGIVLAIVFGIWLRRQTRQVQDNIQRMRTRCQVLRRVRGAPGVSVSRVWWTKSQEAVRDFCLCLSRSSTNQNYGYA